jgi:hypothetical protein
MIGQRFDALDPVLDEQARRRFAAAEARAFGRGGVTLVSKVTGIARSTINRGIGEIEENRSAGEGRVRRPGGGRREGRTVPVSRCPNEGVHAGAISRHLGRRKKAALVKTGPTPTSAARSSDRRRSDRSGERER